MRQEIRETERLRLKQWSEERGKKLQEEEAAAASGQDTSSGASTSRPTPASRKTDRKDNSPVKVRKPVLTSAFANYFTAIGRHP